jgi:hypothetical protein
MALLDRDGNEIPPTVQAAPQIRVCIAIPSGDQVAAGFAFDLAQMVGATIGARPDIDIRIANIQGTIIHKSRRDLVRMAIQGGCTHLLFLDSDMRFPRNTLVRLLSHGEPIVAANYIQRRKPYLPVSFMHDQHDRDRVYTELDSTGLQAVDSTGMGVMLLDLGLFVELSQPWFSFEWFNEGKHMVGEDVYFCRKVKRELGIATLIDHDLSKEVRHVGQAEYEMTDGLVARDMAADEAAQAGLGSAPEVN